jgi:hypothetical protein
MDTDVKAEDGSNTAGTTPAKRGFKAKQTPDVVQQQPKFEGRCDNLKRVSHSIVPTDDNRINTISL